MTLQDEFREYLEKRNYADGTIDSYSSAIKSICALENMISWHELQRNIDKIVALYEPGGVKSKIGATGNNTYINALRRFHEFVNNLDLPKNLKTPRKFIQVKSQIPQNQPKHNKNKLLNDIKRLAQDGWENSKKEHNHYYTHIFQEIKQKVGLL